MTEPMTDARLDEIAARAAHLYESTHQSEEADVLAGVDVPELVAEIQRLRRSCRDLGRCLELAIVTIRAAWVEGQNIGAEEGIEVLAEIVHETGWEAPDLDQYESAEAVFNAEWTASDASTATKRLRAQLAAKEA